MFKFSDVLEYATKLGINIKTEKYFLHLAEEALNTQLPSFIKPW